MSAVPSSRLPLTGPRSRDAVTQTLVKAHFDVEPELESIYVMPPRNPDDPNEPIMMLEVNASTFPSGSVTPFAFSPSEDVPLPVLIAEVTPDERDAALAGHLPLPNGWTLKDARVIQRPK